MPTCRFSKDETVSTCVKSRNPLGVIVLVLLLVSAAFLYTAYYMFNDNIHRATTQPVSLGLSHFMTQLSSVGWCLNSTASTSPVDNEDMSTMSSEYNNVTTTESLATRSTACLQVVAVIPGEYYPQLRAISLYRATMPWSHFFHGGKSSSEEERVEMIFLLQHSLSTSTKHSGDVLVPAYINITTDSQLPAYIREASTCHFPNDNFKHTVLACDEDVPYFRIDQKWEHNLDIFVSMDSGHMNMHLMYTSYFLLISAISIIAYGAIKNRNANKNGNKVKVAQKMPISVY